MVARAKCFFSMGPSWLRWINAEYTFGTESISFLWSWYIRLLLRIFRAFKAMFLTYIFQKVDYSLSIFMFFNMTESVHRALSFLSQTSSFKLSTLWFNTLITLKSHWSIPMDFRECLLLVAISYLTLPFDAYA